MNDTPHPISAARCTAVFLTHLLAAAAVLIVLLKVVPGYAKILKDFDASVPVTTQSVIVLSRWAATWWFLAIVPLGMDAGIIFGLRDLPPAKRWIATAWCDPDNSSGRCSLRSWQS